MGFQCPCRRCQGKGPTDEEMGIPPEEVEEP